MIDLATPRSMTVGEAVDVVRGLIRRGDAVFPFDGHVVAAVAGGWPEALQVVSRLRASQTLSEDGLVPRLIDDDRESERIIVDIADLIDVRDRSDLPPEQPPPGARILVVDDEPDVRALLTRTLHYEGWSTLEASTASEALALIDAHAVDAVVTDASMPGKSGADLAAALIARGVAAPVIIFTGSLPAEDADRARALGIRVVRKPEISVLVAYLRERIQSSRR